MASRTQGTKADTYTWDTLNRLVRVTHPESNGTLKSYRYDYDYRVRRVLRQEGAETTLLMFSGGTSVAELGLATSDFARWQSGVYNHQAQAMQPAPATFTLAKSFVRGSDMGGGVGGLLYSEKQTATAKPGFTVSGGSLGGTAYTASASFNHYNGRGDVVAKTDATGAITWTGAYEAYGKRTKETGVNDDRQRANTKDEDPTGLLNEGMRYRDLETGTWLSRDPAGFVDGPNLYAYVRQNPWTKFDPLGLCDWGWGDAYNQGMDPLSKSMSPAQSATAAVAGAAIVAAGAAGVVYGAGATVAFIAKEATDEAFDVGFEAVTGVPAPPTSITDIGQKLLKEGGQKLFKESAQKSIKEKADNLAKELENRKQAALAKTTSDKGGKAMVDKGKDGVALTKKEAVEAGETVKGEEVTFELPSGNTTRSDVLTTTPDGKLKVRESKNGPSAKMSEGQKEMQETIKNGGEVTPRGKNAEKAGLEPGKPVKIDEHETDHHNKE